MKPVNLLIILGLLVLTACSRPVPNQGRPNTPVAPTAVLAGLPEVATPILPPSPPADPSPTAATPPTAAAAPTATPPAAASGPLRAFEMVDTAAGWGAGDNAVLRSTDGGQSWQVVTPPGLNLDNGAVPQVYAQDALSAWLLVPVEADPNQGTLYRTRDGGQTWQSAAVPFGGGTLQFLSPQRAFVMADRGVAAGSQAVDIYTSGDGGAAWTLLCKVDPQQAGAGCLPFGGNKNGLTFRDETHGWLGGFMPVDGATYLYATLDGGKTWRSVQLPLPAGFEKAQIEVSPPALFKDQEGVLVGRAYLPQADGSVAAELFYRTQDGGQTWQLAATQNSAGLVAVEAVVDWVVWDGGAVLRATHDGGHNWQTIKPNVDLTEKLVALQFVGPAYGWALALEGDTTRLYRTTDGGSTWQ